MVFILDSKELCAQKLGRLSILAQSFLEKEIQPTIAWIDASYESANEEFRLARQRLFQENHIRVQPFVLKRPERPFELIETIKDVNHNQRYHAVLIEGPLPSQSAILQPYSILAPDKDIECLTPQNLGSLLYSKPKLLPPSVVAVTELLKFYKIGLRGKRVVILNRSNTFGQPLALLLTSMDSSVTLLHSHSRDISLHTRQADIIITATGRPDLIRGVDICEGVILIDAGNILESDGKVRGDCERYSCSLKAKAITAKQNPLEPLIAVFTMWNVMEVCRIQTGHVPSVV